MSASISCKQALAAIRRGERLPAPVIRALGEEYPAEFFRIVVEALADSFNPHEAAGYEELMRAWIPPRPRMRPVIPEQVDSVYVLSRVTLGADIKITSAILDAMKRRFPRARIVFAGGRKSSELFAADPRVERFEAEYPRSGPVSCRIEFAQDLRQGLPPGNRIVVDPDSRITQLGLIPVCEPEHYFHFPSRAFPDRTAQTTSNLSTLVNRWLTKTFGECGTAYIAPHPVPLEDESPRAAISLGVGENYTKRIESDFEARLIRELGRRFRTIWIDRGIGGEEALRVTAAAEASGVTERIRFWEGSFAGFASIIARSDFYAGYDSAGQHAAAAAGTPLITFFAGAPSARFVERWSPWGAGRIDVIEPGQTTASECIERLAGVLKRSING